jgi:hypothetical protein
MRASSEVADTPPICLFPTLPGLHELQENPAVPKAETFWISESTYNRM